MTKIQENLNSQIEQSTNLLAQLEAELLDIPNRRALAAGDADSASLIALSHRAGDLPIEIQMTKVRLEQLYLKKDVARLPDLQDEARKLSAAIPELQANLQAAQTELNIAVGAQRDAAQNVKDIKMRISERRRGIDSLLHEVSKTRIAPSHLSVSGSN
jgi:predicted  nucleic acid-binding Zn-ribbon protein